MRPRRNGARATAARCLAAFTLIEILIAVFILALGLLGLGAVFPVVIRGQRIGSEATHGAMAASSARALLSGIDYRRATGNPIGPPFWERWRDSPPLWTAAYDRGQWLVPGVDVNNAVALGPTATLDGWFRLPVSERLYPYGSPHVAPPQFVWDVAVHRVPDDDNYTGNPLRYANDRLQVAVFVRRLDPRLRPTANASVYRRITQAIGGNPPLRPVGADPTTRLPTGDGSGDYALPFVLPVEFRYNPGVNIRERDRLYMPPGTPYSAPNWAMLRQPGQRLIDNLGNIYTVIGSDEGSMGARYVIVDPPVPTYVTAGSAVTVNQVLLTPQVPAAVLVFEVRP